MPERRYSLYYTILLFFLNCCSIKEVDHADMLSIDLEIDGINRTLDLSLNTDLIPLGYKLRRQYRGNYTTEIPQRVVSIPID